MDNKVKNRILYLKEILEKYTDDEHPLTTSQIVQLLEKDYSLTVHRTTIPKDIAMLVLYGMDIVTVKSTQTKYFLGERSFEIPELTLLIDAVIASKFITTSKSERLIEKLIGLTSVHAAKKLKRNMYVTDRIKPENEHIYYIIDAINEAINRNRQITFQYYEYSGLKKKVLRHKGEIYKISPYHLVWNGDFYYVVGFSDKHGKIVSFRVDRIASAPTLLQEEAAPIPTDFDLAKYTKKVFAMFDGETMTVELRCDNSLMKIIIDKFGEDVTVLAYDMTSFRLIVDVSVSPTFYGWLFGFCGKIQILGPEHIKQEYVRLVEQAYLQNVAKTMVTGG